MLTIYFTAFFLPLLRRIIQIFTDYKIGVKELEKRGERHELVHVDSSLNNHQDTKAQRGKTYFENRELNPKFFSFVPWRLGG
jgi:hypothetical protein